MTNLRRMATLLLLALAGFGLFAASAGAQQAPALGPIVQSWALTPASAAGSIEGVRSNLDYAASAGSTISDAVTVANYGNVAMTFSVYAADAFNTVDGAIDVRSFDEVQTDVGAWVRFAQGNVTVQPGTAVTVPITIQVPQDANPGDHIGAVMAGSRVDASTGDGGTVSLERRIGTRINMRVAGPVSPVLAITDVGSSYESSINPLGGTTKVTYRIENQGNVRLSGEVYVSISGPLGVGGRQSESVRLPVLLPGQGLDMEQSFTGVPATVIGTAEVHLAVDGFEGGAVTTMTKSTMSFAVPFSVLAAILVVVLLAWAVRSFRRHGRPKAPPVQGPSDGGGPRRPQPPAAPPADDRILERI